MLSFHHAQRPLEKAIDRGLVAVLQENALSYSSVTKFPREAVLA
jgi:hypothetical protein